MDSTISNATPQVPFRPRASKPKARTGCIVCKIRRVKCDETKPACRRCISTGRQCEGYAQSPSSVRGKGTSSIAIENRSVGLQTSRPSIILPGIPHTSKSTSEKRALHLFSLVAENDMSRHFGDDFWARLVIQTANAYPAVQYALHATSSLYEAYMTGSDVNLVQGMVGSLTSRAAMLRCKAMEHLSGELQRGTRLPCQVVLTCCLLFVWMEYLRNDFEAADTHLRSGLRILRDMEHPSASTPNHVDRTISHMFACLQLQVTIHGSPDSKSGSALLASPQESIITENTPPSFGDIAEARYYLNILATRVFSLIREKQAFEATQGPTANLSPTWPLLIRTRDSHLAHLERWDATFRNSVNLATAVEAGSPASLLLKLTHTMAVMVMKTLFSDSELDYDNYNSFFEQLVGLVEAFLQHPRRETSGPILSLDVGILPCLFYTALKCRDPSIRRRALLALESAPEREGLWHRDSIIAAATWKVAMEEQAWINTDPDAQNVPESIMIYREKIMVTEVDNSKAIVRFAGGPAGSADFEWEISALLARFGEMI